MHAAPALLETQRRFLAAVYDDAEPGPVEAIDGNGLEPAARLRIYRRSGEAIQMGTLRTSYPVVLALVGEAYFDQTVRGFRQTHPSDSGNLQDFGACFADYLASLPGLTGYAYLADIARLEWLRQQSALADDSDTLPELPARRLATAGKPLVLALHPSVRLLASRYRVLTIWRYAMQPSSEPLQLDGAGENVVLWREGGEVAMATPDAASFACIKALARGEALDRAEAVACAADNRFDLATCLESLARQGLIAAPESVADPHKESATCT